MIGDIVGDAPAEDDVALLLARIRPTSLAAASKDIQDISWSDESSPQAA